VSLAFGLALCLSNFGSSCNFLLMPLFSSWHGIDVAVFTGVIACTLSMMSAIVLVVLDARAELVGEIVAQDSSNGPFAWKSIVSFSSSMWLIAFIGLTAYMAIWPFSSVAVQIVEQKYDYQKSYASHVVSISQFVACGACPLAGFLIDRNGRLILWTVDGLHHMICISFIFCSS